MPDSSMPPESHVVTARAVLEYWLARLPRMPQAIGPRCAGSKRASRSVVRLPPKFGFEAWWIRWPPGSVAPLHDHGSSSSVIGVLQGSLSEIVHAPGIGIRARRNWTPERVIEIPGGECHEVRNSTKATATSVHVYQSQLRSMTFYHRGATGQLEATHTDLTSST